MHADLKAVESLDTQSDTEPSADQRNEAAATVPTVNDHKRRKANYREIETLEGVVSEHEVTIAALRQREDQLIRDVASFYKEAMTHLAAKIEAEARCKSYRRWQPMLVGIGLLAGAALAAVLL